MRIVQVYETSNGMFWDKEEAAKRKNRQTYGSEYQHEWEAVMVRYVLIEDFSNDRGGVTTRIFDLGREVSVR